MPIPPQPNFLKQQQKLFILSCLRVILLAFMLEWLPKKPAHFGEDIEFTFTLQLDHIW